MKFELHLVTLRRADGNGAKWRVKLKGRCHEHSCRRLCKSAPCSAAVYCDLINPDIEGGREFLHQ